MIAGFYLAGSAGGTALPIPELGRATALRSLRGAAANLPEPVTAWRGHALPLWAFSDLVPSSPGSIGGHQPTSSGSSGEASL